MRRKASIILSLTIVVFMAACGRRGPDLSRLQIGQYYVAQCNDRDVVLRVDLVTENSLKGRWYDENGYLAKAHHFTAKTGFWHPRKMKSNSLIVKTNAMPGGDILVLDVLVDKSWQTLRFQLWQQPPVRDINRNYPYYDDLFVVTVDSDIVYGHARGYWTSYPEPEYDCDNYLPILMNKWIDADEMTLKDLELDMDVYSPVTSDMTPRPLLMLIHGGAFFNGDKHAIGFEEWANYFASRGYIVASINYRLGFKARGAKHIDRAGYRAVQDARAAMSYLLRHPERYPIDPNYIFVGGSSAGSITALNLAFMTDEDRPTSTEAGPVNEVVNGVAHLFTNRRRDRNNQPREVGLDDLGGINAVADQSGGSVNFTINAVVNMWGAVHKIEMIDVNSPGTAILSFHGDADRVVAYGYGHPFTNLEPINELMCNPMYGSKYIHEHALDHGRVSELYTVKGGSHSLHVSDCTELSDYFTFITNTTKTFLYSRMFPRPTMNASIVGRQQWFELDNAGEIQTCRWEAVGGLVLEAEPDRARVIFFEDEPRHDIRIVGQKKNDEGYDEMYHID